MRIEVVLAAGAAIGESLGMLYVDPLLPPWLPDLTVRNLRLGEQVFDVRFWRSGEDTRFEVLKGDTVSVARRDVIVWSDFLRRDPTALRSA